MLISGFKKNKPLGMGLVEVILAIALFGLFATALIGLLMASYGSDVQASQRDVALLHAQTGVEAVWSIRRQGWNLLENGDHGFDNSNGYWEFVGTSEVIDDNYSRTVNIADACRDGGGNIVECLTPGSTVDVHTKKAIIQVDYTSINGIGNVVELITYLTTWQTEDWIQTNWLGGNGQALWSDETKFDSDDGNIDMTTAGQVTLANVSGAGCGTKVWSFATGADYTYNVSKIEVASNVAQLISSIGVSSGSTANSSFDANSNGWTYNDWGQGGGEVNVTGTYQSSGGNPNGYVDINFPDNSRNDELGGYWEQSFATTVNNPTATVDFDWLVSQFDSDADTFQLYVFVDSFSGAPTIGQQVWSSGEITSAQGWVSQTSIDIASKITTAGTYYLKVAVWLETSSIRSGPFTIGYDNVQLGWSEGAGYPIDNPSINPNDSYFPSDIDSWSTFTETATKNGGEIYYQLSDDNGSTWQYWDGGAWITAGASNYNTAEIINTNISTFATTTGQILFKAFLESDGSQLVQLDSVKIGWGEDTGGEVGYETTGYLVSSAFDMNSSASVNIIEWDQIIPACSPVCTIKFQVRSAPDAGGLPGVWTSWYGEGGAGTYFTDHTGTIISTDLNNNQWLQYRVEFLGDGNDTPVLEEVRINYLP